MSTFARRAITGIMLVAGPATAAAQPKDSRGVQADSALVTCLAATTAGASGAGATAARAERPVSDSPGP
jgi:hypothetical protein